MKKPEKLRADEALVAQGLVPSRSRAQALIMAGKVLIGDQLVKKPGQSVQKDAKLTLKEKDHPWVSRGGLKLAHALDHFNLSLIGKTIIDVGASTGGFTDVALKGGAVKVYAVDVGKGQLDWGLRGDKRVEVMEGTNARYLTSEEISDPVDVIVCDASFISLKTILPAPLSLLAPGGLVIALIKPQFEVGKGKVGKGGVVRDPDLHDEVKTDIQSWFEGLGQYRVLGITESPITGPKGNVEFLIAAQRD